MPLCTHTFIHRCTGTLPARSLCVRTYTHSHASAYTYPYRITPSSSRYRKSSGWELGVLGRRRKAEGNSNQGTTAGLPGEVWVGGSVRARVCVSLNVWVQYLEPFHCLLSKPLGGPSPPPPCSQKEIEARAEQLGLGRSASPSLGLASLSICVVLGTPRPDKDWGQSSALVGKDSLEGSRPIPFPDVGPQSRQQEGKGDGWGTGRAPSCWAGELEGVHSRFRFTDAQECAVTPQTSPGTSNCWAWSRQKGMIPDSLLSAQSGLETLCSREAH